ncbi:sugar ABC transporter permease [Desertihabitans brevis]|uniref:Sugar ABC transporter permease n=1 Tax=Desertihabitans brevis TaxID=2268447 RepID=A0A367YRT3_9ACTN|nr:sugar ABC transporter permease [Desertihabitans brevis]RCK68457.1 sugar ABC transporter permease [Desertihabitans brevis]
MTLVQTQAGPGGAPAPAGRPRSWFTRNRRNLTFGRISFFAVFLGVPLAIYAVLVLSPFIQAVQISFTNWGGFSRDFEYIGFRNYAQIFTNDAFLTALRNNIILVIVLPLVTLVLSLALASIVTVGGASNGEVKGLRGSSFYRVISFFPYVVPAIVIGLIWGMVYNPRGGLVNGFLTTLGFSAFESFPWLGDPRTAMGATIFVIVWSMVGFYMVLFIAAIRGVDPSIFEAARLDGAGRFRTAVTITIPLIRDNVQTAWIYLGILALDAFVYMRALNPQGGPDRATWVMSQELFDTAFVANKWGLASAMGVVLALVTLAFAALVFLVNRLTGAEKEGGYQ